MVVEILHPLTGETVDATDFPVEAGLVRIAVLGVSGFALAFDDPPVREALAGCVGEGGGPSPFAPELLRPFAVRGLAALEAGAADDERLRILLGLWRARALALAGRVDEVAKDDVHRERLRTRLRELHEAMDAARAAGDDDRAEALHARYVELGTTYAGRLAALWAGPGA